VACSGQVGLVKWLLRETALQIEDRMDGMDGTAEEGTSLICCLLMTWEE